MRESKAVVFVYLQAYDDDKNVEERPRPPKTRTYVELVLDLPGVDLIEHLRTKVTKLKDGQHKYCWH